MRESSTYQEIIAEGRSEGRQEGLQEGRLLEGRRNLLRIGSRRFGEPSPAVRDAINAIGSLEGIELLIDRSLELESWDQLF